MKERWYLNFGFSNNNGWWCHFLSWGRVESRVEEDKWNEEFSFSYVKFELLFRDSGKMLNKKLAIQFSREMGEAEVGILRVTCVYMVFKGDHMERI